MNLRNIVKVVMKMPVAFLQSARRAMILGMLSTWCPVTFEAVGAMVKCR
jgi:hypothetical protein